MTNVGTVDYVSVLRDLAVSDALACSGNAGLVQWHDSQSAVPSGTSSCCAWLSRGMAMVLV